MFLSRLVARTRSPKPGTDLLPGLYNAKYARRRGSPLRCDFCRKPPRCLLRPVFALFLILATFWLLPLPHVTRHSIVSWTAEHVPFAGLDGGDLDGFYSQWGQDRWVADYLRGRDDLSRVVVEFGANDGLRHSNTAYFERVLGFSGLCLEPNLERFGLLLRNRPGCTAVHTAVGDCDAREHRNRTFLTFKPRINTKTGLMREDSGLGGWADSYHPETLERLRRHIGPTLTRTVPCQRLDQLLDSAGITRIDYLSVDTEGSELEALRTLDWDRFLPTVVQFESRREFRNLTTHVLSEKERQLRELLELHGYRLAAEFTSPRRLKRKMTHKTFDLIFVQNERAR